MTAAFFAFALSLASGRAFAQVDNAAIAEELFNDAKRLLDQGKADQACPKFAESLRLDPTLGTRLNLAHCYEVLGRNATAWGQYKEVARTAGGDTRRAAIARERIAALEPTLSRVLINGSAETGLKLTLDGDQLDAAVLGTAFPIDPGDHHLELSAPDKKPRTMTFHVDKAQTQTVEIAPLDGVAPSGAQPPPTVETQTTEPAPPPPPPTEVSQGKHIGGWVAIGSGVAALGVGVALGIVTLGLASDVRNECPTGPCPTQDGIDKNNAAHTDALLSDIFIPVGIVAAAVGTWLVLTSSRRVKPASAYALPFASPAGGGVAVGGAF